jgi:23S rRNA pseudouridine1911/1915/1917 synthase
MNKNLVKIIKGKKLMIAYLKEDMNLSSKKAKRLLRNGEVILNNKKAYGDSVVRNGDIVQIFQQESQRDRITPQEMPLTILYEDEFLLAIDKPPFMAMYPAKGKGNKDTLANGIRYYFDLKKITEPVRFYNRLDMNTSGIILIPKDGQTHSLLYRLSSKTMIKMYKAVVKGVPGEDKGFIAEPISEFADEAGKRVVSDGGREALTEYRISEVYHGSSLLDVFIKTGRTHQIRSHLSFIGHPVIGDGLYGEQTILIGRQALHATKLEFFHPYANKRITIISSLPEDIKELIESLKIAMV